MCRNKKEAQNELKNQNDLNQPWKSVYNYQHSAFLCQQSNTHTGMQIGVVADILARNQQNIHLLQNAEPWTLIFTSHLDSPKSAQFRKKDILSSVLTSQCPERGDAGKTHIASVFSVVLSSQGKGKGGWE